MIACARSVHLIAEAHEKCSCILSSFAGHVQPENVDALSEINDIRTQVQRRKREDQHTRVQTVEPD